VGVLAAGDRVLATANFITRVSKRAYSDGFSG